MTTTQIIDCLTELSVNLKATADKADISERERQYLSGLCDGIRLAADTIRKHYNDEKETISQGVE